MTKKVVNLLITTFVFFFVLWGENIMKKGRIITLSGMSGVGKSYLIKRLLSRTECFEKLKAVTTRKIRDDEINGVDKYFISMQDFVEKDNNGEMCVVNEVFGNMYGYYNMLSTGG